MIWTVTNSDELSVVFKAAQSGDRIELAPGTYNSAHLKSRDFPTEVVIASQDAENPAVFTDALTMSNVSGVTLTGISFEPNSAALDILDLVLIQNASRIMITDNAFKGHIPESGEGLPPDAPIDSADKAKGLIEGQPFARGLRATNVEDLTVEGNVLTALRKGIILDDTHAVLVQENHLHDLRSDGINIVDSRSVEISANLMQSFRPLHNYEHIEFADHGDFIQWWITDTGQGIHDMTIRDNVLLQGAGTWVQGIFGRGGLSNPDGSPAHISGLRILDNVINISHPNGIFVGDARDVEIAGNTLLPAPRDPSHPEITDGIPAIHVRTSAPINPDGSYDFSQGALPRDVVIRDNLVASGDAFRTYQIDSGLHAGLGIVAESNTALSIDVAEIDYFGNPFPGLVDRAIAVVSDLEPVGGAGALQDGVDPSTLPQWIKDTLEEASALSAPPVGTPLDDVLVAPASGATLDGEAGDDLIEGGGAADLIRGGAGSDTMTMGGGADTVIFHRDDLLRGDADTITDLDFTTGSSISFSGGFVDGFFDDAVDGSNALSVFANGRAALISDMFDLAELAAHDSVSAVATLRGETELRFDLDGDDQVDWTLRLRGVSAIGEDTSGLVDAASVFVGSVSSDVLRGTSAGHEDLFGGAGDDLLDGRGGTDRMSGGEGDDSYYVDHVRDQSIERDNHGYDRVYTTVDYTLSEHVEGLSARGSADLRLTGNQANNWLTGNGGDNAIRGNAGSDRLIGRDGSDWLDGGTGGDVMQGGAGDDSYVVDDPRDLILERAGEGHDRVYSSVDYDLDAFIEVAGVRGPAGLSINGNSLNNWITGGTGNDRLSGGDGNDRLLGRDGDDYLSGGSGVDVLQGGAGADVFAFSAEGGADVVLDFQAGTDRLDIGFLTSGASLRAMETSTGVLIMFGPGDGQVLLAGVTENELSTAVLQISGQDWSLDF
ncbi:MAG: right-handed parallel beta-helix repeat-containing protein [Pseudomonadota bacterium]